MDKILLAHGDGGLLTHRLIEEIFVREFGSDILGEMGDAAGIECGKKIAFATDSFVVSPIFFPGGDIGKLACAGTVNDLSVYGSKPRFLSVSFILEEGTPMEDLIKVARSLGETARFAGVKIAAGDTKVVEKGKGDKIYINTAGVGEMLDNFSQAHKIKTGDAIIVSGNIGDHGAAIISRRAGIDFESVIKSDCAPLNHIIVPLWEAYEGIRLMRDPTRGGVATTLKEIAMQASKDFLIYEELLPFDPQVRSAAEVLGLDPLYLANEGKFIAVVDAAIAGEVVNFIRRFPEGENAAVIGEVLEGRGDVKVKTPLGGTKLLDMLTGEQLPRIC
ncbi:MAG: hydrogenase expression/formation protein HypE [Clostridia bacterium]|nr:hydrogenase expression/formation protein HypE [Clostridia bacterium]